MPPIESTSEVNDRSGREPNGGSTGIRFICWVLIAAAVALLFFAQQTARNSASVEIPSEAELVTFVFRGKLMLGAQQLSKAAAPGQEPEKPEWETLAIGSVRQRQAASVLAAEMESREKGLEILESIEELAVEQGYQLNEIERGNQQTLKELFEGRSVAELPAVELDRLESELLWFGELALVLKNDRPTQRLDAQRTNLLNESVSVGYRLGTLAVLLVLASGIGLIGLVHAWTLADSKIEMETDPMVPSVVLLEGFTIWLVTLILGSLVLGAVGQGIHPLLISAMVFAISLAAGLGWQVTRGVSLRRLLRSIGVQGPFIRELVIGVWCYIRSLPLLAVALAVTVLLIEPAQGPVSNDLRDVSVPPHPVLGWIIAGDWITITLILLVTTVCAPIVEELVFRGMLFGYLRRQNRSTSRFRSTLIAAIINGLIFALIHPQGLGSVPLLATLAIAFSFAREYRGSIYSAMTMHAIHNGLTSIVLFMVLL